MEFLVSLGVLLGMWISVRNSERLGIDGEKAWNLGILVVLCGIVGAKVLYVINEGMSLRDILSISTLQAGGVFSGGLIAAFIAAAWYVRRHHMPPLGTCDAFAPGLAFGHAIGRLGCFAAGCCYGKPTHHFWGVTFTNPLANSITGTPLNIPLEPTQLFESAVELANFFFSCGCSGAASLRARCLGHSYSSTESRASSWNTFVTIPDVDRSSAAR